MRCLVTCGVGVAMWLATALAHGEDASRLVRMLPREVNSLVIVRAAEILKTDRAVRERWADRQEQRFLHGQTSAPPWAETLVIGSLLRPGPESAWSAALLTAPESIKFESLGAGQSPEVEYLGRSRVIHGRRNALVLELQPGLFGVMSPPYRQDAGRWSRQIAAGEESEVSAVLQEASALPGHIVLAMDLQDLLDPHRVRAGLESEPQLADKPSIRVKLATQILRIRGATMSITIGDEIDSLVTLTFGDDVGDAAPALHAVFLRALADLGAGLDELDTAEVRAEGPSLHLQTKLSEESLRRVMSVIVPPAPEPSPASAPAPTSEPAPAASSSRRPPTTRGAATRQYVLSVNKMIDDLKVANQRAKTYARTATWHDNFARKIGDLPTKGVDRDALQYGSSIAEKLRALAASLRGQGVRVSTAEGGLTYSYSYDPGWGAVSIWGGVAGQGPSYNIQTNLGEVRERQAEAISAGSDQRGEIWKSIDDERAAIEQTLRVRYGDDFLR